MTDTEKNMVMAGIDPQSGVVTDLNKVPQALNQSKLGGFTPIEVSEDIFTFLSKGQDTPWLMYEGVPVYRAGTMVELQKRESMRVDDYLNLLADERKAKG